MHRKVLLQFVDDVLRRQVSKWIHFKPPRVWIYQHNVLLAVPVKYVSGNNRPRQFWDLMQVQWLFLLMGFQSIAYTARLHKVVNVLVHTRKRHHVLCAWSLRLLHGLCVRYSLCRVWGITTLDPFMMIPSSVVSSSLKGKKGFSGTGTLWIFFGQPCLMMLHRLCRELSFSVWSRSPCSRLTEIIWTAITSNSSSSLWSIVVTFLGACDSMSAR